MKMLWSRVVLGAIVIITACGVLSSIFGWNLVLELLSHFQIQYFGLTLILSAVLVGIRQKGTIIIGLFCLTLLLLFLLPWYFSNFSFSTSTNSTNLRILSANVNIGNSDYTPILNLIEREKPDLVILIEVNQKWVDRLDSLNQTYPFSLGNTENNAFNVIVYSTRSLANSKIDFWGVEQHKSPVIQAQQTINNQTISVLAVHPPPPFKRSFFQTRNYYLNQISRWTRSQSTPVAIAGDLNITMWSPYYQQLIRETALKNTRQGFGLLPTWILQKNWPHWLYFVLGLPIDHCLVSPEIKVVNMKIGPDIKSDHLPIIVDLDISSF
jgi:endonuclease/exonuclease/phosphatase (EEP) superfamily protein YafD